MQKASDYKLFFLNNNNYYYIDYGAFSDLMNVKKNKRLIVHPAITSKLIHSA